MDTANLDYFNRPETIRIARGEVVSNRPDAKGWQVYGADGSVVIQGSNGGISAPRAITIPTGRTLVRLGNGPFAGEVASGGWWLDWANYKIVERYANSIGATIAAAVRNLCAVPVEWGSMTMLIQATTRSPLSAYAGHGNLATAVSRLGIRSTIDPSQFGAGRVEQLYIPGLAAPDLRKVAILVTGYGWLPAEGSTQGYRPELGLNR